MGPFRFRSLKCTLVIYSLFGFFGFFKDFGDIWLLKVYAMTNSSMLISKIIILIFFDSS